MKISHLEIYGLPANIIGRWKQRYGDDLLSVQEKAVRDYRVLQGENLVVFAPTSSGKTFIGEMAAIHAAEQTRKVFYLVPLKAMAHEKYEEFKEQYKGCALDIVLSDRDYSRDDHKIRNGQFHIAIVVYEKLQGLLVSNPHLIESVGLVIIDELQMLADESRGGNLELLLTKILMAGKPPQILGLSAVLGKADSLARWLNAQLLIENKRPIELRKGILHRDTFHYKEHNSQKEKEEKLLPVEAETADDAKLYAAAEFASKGESTLIFWADKKSTIKFAEDVWERVNLPSATKALKELDTYEPSAAKEMLTKLLQRGIAFHNADLSWEYRSLIEQAFRDGEVKLLSSTSTLAMGMNLPCVNVIIDRKKWEYSLRYRKVIPGDITRMEFENMSGRAGRFASNRDFGRALLATHSQFDVWALTNCYINKDFEDIEPAMAKVGIDEQVLNLFASGLVTTVGEAAEFLLRSFAGQEVWSQEMTKEEFQQRIEKAVETCVEGRLLQQSVKGKISATPEGRVASIKGLKVDTACIFVDYLDSIEDEFPHPLEVFLLLGTTQDGDLIYTNMSTPEYRSGDYIDQFRQALREESLLHNPIFKDVLQGRYREYEEVKILKKALILHDWILETPVGNIESHYATWEGQVRKIAEDYAWLVDSLAMMMVAQEWDEEFINQMSDLRTRLELGVMAEGVKLSNIRVRGLGRISTRKLIDAGLKTLSAIKDAPFDQLKAILKNGTLVKRLVEAVELYSSQNDIEELVEAEGSDVKTTADYEFILDPLNHQVTFQEVLVDLSPIAFKLVDFLAKHAGEFCSARMIMKELWGAGENDNDLQPVHDNVRLIRDRAEEAFRSEGKTPKDGRRIIVSKKSAGYRLNAQPDLIQVQEAAVR